MGIIRLTLITAALLWLAMYYYGRDDGLPENRLGRAPSEAAAPVTPVAAEPDAGGDDAPDPAPDAAPTPEPIPEPEPPAEPAADPEPATQPEATAEAAPQPEPANTPEPEPDTEPEPPAPETPAEETMLYVTAQRLNVRTGPSTDFDVITSLPRGAAVTDLGEADDGWRQVRLETGEIAFISGDFLSPDPQ